jgi:hypothetical protein
VMASASEWRSAGSAAGVGPAGGCAGLPQREGNQAGRRIRNRTKDARMSETPSNAMSGAIGGCCLLLSYVIGARAGTWDQGQRFSAGVDWRGAKTAMTGRCIRWCCFFPWAQTTKNNTSLVKCRYVSGCRQHSPRVCQVRFVSRLRFSDLISMPKIEDWRLKKCGAVERFGKQGAPLWPRWGPCCSTPLPGRQLSGVSG